MTDGNTSGPRKLRFTCDATGWSIIGLTGSEGELQEEIESKLLGEIRVTELPQHEAVVGHVEATGCWFVFLKDAGEYDMVGVLLSNEEYRRLGFDPFLVGAMVLGSKEIRNLVENGSVRTRDQEGHTDKLGTAYALFLAGVSGSHSAVYCSHPTGGGSGGEAGWADMDLLRVDAARAGQGEGVSSAAAAAALQRLERRLEDTEQALRSRTRLLVVAVVMACALPLLIGFQVWTTVTAELTRLRVDKVDMATFIEGFYLNTEGEVSAEDALLAKLNDLATAAVQSGAWQEGLRSRGVEPGELLDTLVAVSSARQRLVRLAQAEPRLVELAGAQATLSRLAANEEALGKLAAVEPPLSSLAAVQSQLSSVAGSSEALGTLATRSDAVVLLAELQAPLVNLARQEPALMQLQQQRSGLLALAGRRSEIEAQLQRTATLDTMIGEMTRVLTFMEQRQADLEQLARRKEAVIQLTDSRTELSELARKQRTLDRLADSGDRLLGLANDIHLQRLVANDKALDVISSRLDELSQLTLRSAELLRLADTSAPATR